MRKRSLVAFVLMSAYSIAGAAPVVGEKNATSTAGKESTVRVIGTVTQEAPQGARAIPPDDFLYLQQNASRLTDESRQEYFARWQAFAEAALDCETSDQLRWFLQLALWTGRVDEIRARSAAAIERLAREDPRCLLRGIRDLPFRHSRGRLLRQYIFTPDHGPVAELDMALRGALGESEFSGIARIHAKLHEQYQERVARERAAQERRLARERQEYWSALQRPAFYRGSPTEYWQRWQKLADQAKECADAESVTYLLQAAAHTSHIDAARRRNAGVIEALVMDDAACVLRALEDVRKAGSLMDEYLLAPSSHTVEELHAAITRVPDEDSRALRAYRERYQAYRYRIADPVTNPDAFLWSVKMADAGRDGRIFVPATYIKGHSEFQARLNELWDRAPAGNLRDHRGDPIKILPLNALDFMTLHQFGTYYLLNITREGVETVKARAVNTALARWACGDVASLLVLEPETEAERLVQSDPTGLVAVELRDDLRPPETKKLDWPTERYFYDGRLRWSSVDRSLDFSYSDAYVGIHFDLTDDATGEKHHAREFSDDPCH